MDSQTVIGRFRRPASVSADLPLTTAQLMAIADSATDG